MYLVDTNVVSELRKARPHGAVVEWLEGVDDSALHISAVTLGEIQRGIEFTRQHDPVRAEAFNAWADQLSMTFKVLPMDGPIFRLWAGLMHRKSEAIYEDAMIAATALRHGLIVVTRNVRDFTRFSVPLLNPFKSAI